MWCRHVRSQLSAYADGELSQVEARLVETHLTACDDCSREHASLQRLVRLTTAIPAEDVPTGLHSSIMMRLAYADVAPSRPAARRSSGFGLSMFNPWMWTALSGATAALVVGLIQRPAPEAVPPVVGPERSPSEAAAPRETERAEAHRPTAPPAASSPATPAAPAAPASISGEVGAQPALSDGAGMAAAALPAPPPVESARTAPAARRQREALSIEEIVADPPAGTVEGAAKSPTAPSAMAAMPGDPMINSVGVPPNVDELMLGMEKESGTPRMAGSPEAEMPTVDDDEGVRALRMFLEERGRTVPQPPAAPPSSRRKL